MMPEECQHKLIQLPVRYLFFLIVGVTLLLRLWGTFDVKVLTGDEPMHVPSALNYVQSGHQTPEHWFHPPLRHLLLYANMRLFGDNPYGWRMLNVFAGTLSVLVLLLLGRELFSDAWVGYLAAVMLMLDPLHLVLSRSTMTDVLASVFFLLALLSAVRYAQGAGRFSSPVLAGLFLGLAMAIKWYFVPASLVMAIYVLAKKKWGGWQEIAYFITSLALLPVIVYLLVYLPWIGRGYSLPEFFVMQVDAVRAMKEVCLESFIERQFLSKVSSPWLWFLAPAGAGSRAATIDGWSQYFVFVGNPLLWISASPALCYAAYTGLKKRNGNMLLIVFLFFSIYFQFIVSKRPLFIYSALQVLPFAYLALSCACVALIDRFKRRLSVKIAILTLIIASGAYLYPLAANKFVPHSLYTPAIWLFSIQTR